MLDDKDVRLKETRVYYMQMIDEPKGPCVMDPYLEFVELNRPIDVPYYIELYQGVGLNSNWVDRLILPEDELYELINREQVSIFMILYDEDPCGFVEFEQRAGYVEILYFGLFQEYWGRGLGVNCLRKAVEIAWSYRPEWLQLNTCDLNVDNARAIYEKVGFEHYTTRIEMRQTFM